MEQNTTVDFSVLLATKKETKADKALIVFMDCYKDLKNVPQRKDIINRLVSECGLTVNGAATYLQNMKKKAGLVNSKK